MPPKLHFSRARVVAATLSALLIVGPTAAAGAQATATPTASEPRAETATLAAGAPRALAREDLKSWKTIRTTALSADGRWFAYLLAPNEGNAEVIIRPTAGGAERRFAVGQAASGASVTISDDSRWAAFLVHPTFDEQKRMRTQKRPIRARATVVELATGDAQIFDLVQRFAFAGENGWIALRGYQPEGARAVVGADLRLVELGTGQMLTFGGVGDFGFDDRGRYLAWTVDVAERVGNGVQLRDISSGVVRSIDGERALYRNLTWSDTGRSLTVLRGVVDSVQKDTAWAVLGVADAARAGRPLVFTTAGRTDVPEGMRVNPARTPQWTTDRRAITLGVSAKLATPPAPDSADPSTTAAAGANPPTATPSAADDELADLVLWHTKDPRLQSMQQVQEGRDRSSSYLSVWFPTENRFVRLADENMRDVSLAPGSRWAVGVDERAYEREGNLSGRRARDLYAIDARTGERTLAVPHVTARENIAPDGSRFLIWKDAHYHVYDFARATLRPITQQAPVSFVNVEDDHNVENPPLPTLGWSADSRAVLLSDAWDIWMVAADGSRATNLTADGRERGVRYQRRVFPQPQERGIPTDRPIYFATYGERTKQEGVARVDTRRPGARMLTSADARLTPIKARDADVVLFTRQTALEFPNWHATDLSFTAPRQLTDANPQQRDVAWSSGARLIGYVSDKGDSLQAALFLPAGYQEGQSYPTVVYIYEKLSQGLHSYNVPNETRALNPSLYTAGGYAVLMPDITYKINDPGMSAVWSVLPAVKAAIASGVVDSAKVGLHGHSWGGYQTAFLVTQTTMFRAAIAGAPLTDMVSMYSSVYWNTGSANQPIFESSQGRFRGNFLENTEAYVRNSPNRFADKIETPLIILHNDKDGAVDFNQGITFYNTLRQLGKDVILLQYTGENHGLAKPANQKDYAIRMREYFDHHLLGAPAPDWMENGVPRLEMRKHLEDRAKALKAATAAKTAMDNDA